MFLKLSSGIAGHIIIERKKRGEIGLASQIAEVRATGVAEQMRSATADAEDCLSEM